MKYCISCGKKVDEKLKYCTHCGQNLKSKVTIKKKERYSKPHSIPIMIISVLFIILLGLFIANRIQSSSENYEGNTILPRTLSDNLIKIADSDNSGNIRKSEIKREGYSVDAKPFDNRNYAYDERTKDFRLVCANPCPVSKSILDQEFAAISYAVSTTRGLTQSDIDKSLLPFEVHATEDNVCTSGSFAAYMTQFTDLNGHRRGLLCFFYDEIEYNRDKFPYSTSIHEVMHLFEANKVPHDAGQGGSVLWEGLSEMMDSFFLKGNERDSFCWKGNKWWGTEVGIKPVDSHPVGRELFFQLCNQYRFDYDDLPELFEQLESRNGNVDEEEFVRIINRIVNADTSHLFRNAGVI